MVFWIVKYHGSLWNHPPSFQRINRKERGRRDGKDEPGGHELCSCGILMHDPVQSGSPQEQVEVNGKNEDIETKQMYHLLVFFWMERVYKCSLPWNTIDCAVLLGCFWCSARHNVVHGKDNTSSLSKRSTARKR